ncbi:hypothetical protein BO82DRAFT_434896 [Aspergillus uvarum CBS 121591]|uniref:Uncharacterized protein n=1 Tax=Aspergillus uvarum CBS 121591 TaxID=1448315 RepID=A0A319C4A0_9EURO|nr:hypothetical protein BO82DRAFT_434896 [Aspergillus uvarum CBS 121591]PYH78679.1 hypothetical protein BO82DRAFT_434896 [Aspergillus uvarum CBS 121591]
MATPIPWGYLAGELVAIWLAFGAACVLGSVTCAPLDAFGYNMCGNDRRVAMFADPLMDYLTLIWFSLGSSCCAGWLFCLFLNLLRRNICDDYEFWEEWLYTWFDVSIYFIVFWAFWHTIMNHNPDLELDGVR